MLKRMTPIQIALWGLVALALCAVLWMQVLAPKIQGSAGDTLGRGDYRLTSSDGTIFTDASLRGAPSAVFFGFTHCPEVCPTTLGDISRWQEDIAADGLPLRVFFVTVDPERDTNEVLKDYASWVPGVTGLTGTREEIDKAIRAFRIYAKKVPLEGEDYTMDHSASILLFDARGRFFEPIGYGEGDERAENKIRRLMGG
jgi:protein SCO1/2